MKAVFMGTPEIAATILRGLLEAKKDITAVVTQPDKPKGRGNQMQFSEVKKVAMEYEIPVYQPVKAREEGFVEQLRQLKPDIILVAAFGQILTKSILDIPPLGCINVHASLLPKYRGAAPIQQVIIDGEEKTGVTIMKMDAGIDTGDMIIKSEIAIDPKETYDSLQYKLAVVGTNSLLEALQLIQDNRAVYEKQQDELSSYAKPLTKEMGKLDFTKEACVLERLIRGMNPWPCCYTSFEEKTLKIWCAEVNDDFDKPSVPVGTIIDKNKSSFTIQTSHGGLVVKEVQLEGKKRMMAGDFLRGVELKLGTILGES
jgi:methionyl-tRNA formyltransferase